MPRSMYPNHIVFNEFSTLELSRPGTLYLWFEETKRLKTVFTTTKTLSQQKQKQEAPIYRNNCLGSIDNSIRNPFIQNKSIQIERNPTTYHSCIIVGLQILHALLPVDYLLIFDKYVEIHPIQNWCCIA